MKHFTISFLSNCIETGSDRGDVRLTVKDNGAGSTSVVLGLAPGLVEGFRKVAEVFEGLKCKGRIKIVDLALNHCNNSKPCHSGMTLGIARYRWYGNM